ncbi:hypothetical protein SNE40_021683 [Patella caerulea]|uniref:Reverse transcriptase domain-containing protein n=1 Tax=Patella caerulea TaxID=87958 RepID=A0AAN8J4C1_PATCE
MLEHIICSHLMTHLENHNILTNLQHGFRAKHSCESQLLITTHDIMNMYDRKQQVDIAILDFSKAFDTVPHKKLLYKLESYGVNTELLTWINSFLTKRTQCVVVEGKTSSSVRVESGVPQGTCLGPILFLIHINDLPLRVKSTVRLFADDCLLYRTINSLEDHYQLQSDLQSLEIWAKEWGMSFNAKKCYILGVSRSKKPNTYIYQLCDTILEEVDNNPYLGVIISNSLKWSKHINKTVNKAHSTLGFLRHNLRKCPRSLKITAYQSLVRSVLEYCSSIWDPHSQTDILSLEKIRRTIHNIGLLT